MTRLIDVDELKQYIDDGKCCEKCDKIGFMCNEHCKLPCSLTLQWERVLNEQPTVDAVPVRHGRWIEDGSFKYKHGGRNSEAKELFGTEWRTMRRIKCSLCNKITLVDDTILYEYCPHCGARMDERKEE